MLKHPYLYFTFLILKCTLFVTSAKAQMATSTRYMVEALGNHKSLNSSEVLALYQDKDGYIWVGNQPGISRFDGYEFQNYTKADSIFLGSIHAIAEDSNGQLWAGGTNGLFYYKNGQFYATSIQEDVIRTLHLGKNQELWVGGLGFVPYALSTADLANLQNNQNISIHPIVTVEEWEKEISILRTWALDTDKNGQLWLGLDTERASFDGEKLHVYWKKPNPNIADKYTSVVAFDQDSVFWGSESMPALFQRKHQFDTLTQQITETVIPTDSSIYFLTLSRLLALKNGQWFSGQ